MDERKYSQNIYQPKDPYQAYMKNFFQLINTMTYRPIKTVRWLDLQKIYKWPRSTWASAQLTESLGKRLKPGRETSYKTTNDN